MGHQGNKETILITGATGNVGLATIRSLCHNKNVNIRALVKSDETQSQQLHELSNLENVKVVQGNLDNAEQLNELLDGVNRALLVCPNVPNQVQMERNFIEAAKKRKLDLLVKVSILSPMGMVSTESPVGFAQSHAEVEEVLKNSGLNFIVLRPNFFFENILWMRDEIVNENSLSVPCAKIPATMVAVEDVGKITSSLLLEHKVQKKLLGKTIDICGPEPLSFEEICRRLSKRLGRDIQLKEIDSNTFVERLKNIDISEDMRNGLKPVFDQYWCKGAFNCPGTKEDLPVTPSIKFDQWLDKNISLLQAR